MALRIELNRAVLEAALEQRIASLKRAKNTNKNPDFQVLYDKDLRELQHATNTITEIK